MSAHLALARKPEMPSEGVSPLPEESCDASFGVFFNPKTVGVLRAGGVSFVQEVLPLSEALVTMKAGPRFLGKLAELLCKEYELHRSPREGEVDTFMSKFFAQHPSSIVETDEGKALLLLLPGSRVLCSKDGKAYEVKAYAPFVNERVRDLGPDKYLYGGDCMNPSCYWMVKQGKKVLEFRL